MRKEEKQKVIDALTEQLNSSPIFYLTDISGLDADASASLRRACHTENIQLQVMKNTLLKRAFDAADSTYDELYDTLKGNTSVMFAQVGNVPAKVIKTFRKKHDKPLLKGAFINESIYVGENQLEFLSSIKSKEEIIGDIIGLLQSPAKNVISGLQASAGGKIAGIVKALSNKEK